MSARRARVLALLAAGFVALWAAGWVAYGEAGLLTGLIGAAVVCVLMAYLESAHGSA